MTPDEKAKEIVSPLALDAGTRADLEKKIEESLREAMRDSWNDAVEAAAKKLGSSGAEVWLCNKVRDLRIAVK